MLEHMMFKGTEKLLGGEFTRAIEQIGGNDNAFTSHDYTAYYENVSADRVQVPIDFEADRMQNLLLKEGGLPNGTDGGPGREEDAH